MSSSSEYSELYILNILTSVFMTLGFTLYEIRMIISLNSLKWRQFINFIKFYFFKYILCKKIKLS